MLGISLLTPIHAGSDSAAGTLAAPFATVERAIEAYEAAGTTGGAIVLRGGVHYLQRSIALNTTHSGLSILNYRGEEAWL